MESPETARRVEAWREELDRIRPALVLADRGLLRVAALHAAAGDLEQKTLDLGGELTRLRAAYDIQSQHVVQIDGRLGAAEGAAAQQAQNTVAAQREAALQAGVATHLRETLNDVRQRHAAHLARLARCEERIAELENAAAADSRRVAELEAQASDAQAALLREAGLRSAAEEEARRLVAQKEALARDLAQEQAMTTALQGQVEDQRQALAAHGVEQAHLRQLAGSREVQCHELELELVRLRERVLALPLQAGGDASALAAAVVAVRAARAPGQRLRWAILLALRPIRSLRLERDIRLVKDSGCFDVDFYLQQNSDVRASAADPVRHYCEFGWAEGRNPSASFDTHRYLQVNPDVARSGANPLVHFLRFGRTEGRTGMAVKTV
jgi:hypothetical protein